MGIIISLNEILREKGGKCGVLGKEGEKESYNRIESVGRQGLKSSPRVREEGNKAERNPA